MSRHIKIIIATSLLAFFTKSVFASPPQQIKLDVALGSSVLHAEQRQTVPLKITLRGLPLENTHQRPPVNVALVLDRSGSMGGQKMEQAREAAITALDYLSAQDIVSIVSYDDYVDVLVPATKVSDKANIASAIRRLHARGSTALFAGVSKGADEARKFLDKNQANRVILLSDGIANVGPSSPSDLARLGKQLIQEGISVTTLGLGLGYNEDLMTQLANNSDGNHAFVENANDLATIFGREFGDLLSIVAQSVEITIECAEGIRPIRLLGREGNIRGQRVSTYLNQLYGDQEKYILLEMEVPATAPETQRDIAKVDISYINMATQNAERINAISAAQFSQSDKKVQDSTDKDVMVSTVEQIAVEKNKEAVKLRDEGRIKEAEEALRGNAEYLKEKAEEYDSDRLRDQSDDNKVAADKASAPAPEWNKQRKQMRKDQHQIENQQSY